MSGPFQPGNMSYVQSNASAPNLASYAHLDVRDPAVTDILYPISKVWVNTVLNTVWVLTSQTSIGGVIQSVWTETGSNSVTVVSGAASGTVTANGRVVSVTFTGVSIAAGAIQAFTTSNTSITGSGTVLLLSMVGATSGAALNVQSIVNSASQSVITVENGTGATTSTANITFTYMVLN